MSDWTRYDRPELLDALTGESRADGTRELLLAVDGVHCGACVRGVETALGEDVTEVHVDLASRTAVLRFSPARTRLSALLSSLARAGFQPRVLAQDEDGEPAQMRTARRRALARVGVAVICSMQVMMLAWPEYFDADHIDAGILQLMRWSQWLIATPAVFYSGWPFIDSAWRALRTRQLNMDVPVAASILIAYAASGWRTWLGEGALYFDAATMFVMLLGLGRYLEGRTRAVAGERLRQLAQRRLLQATRIEAGVARSVPLSALAPGDHLRVAPGEALPADGVLLDAHADLDESLLTGEARPVRHQAGELLLGGSLNIGLRALELRATATGAATRLSAITRLLHRARQDKPRVQLLADRIAGHFVLAVLLLAVAGAAFWWPRDPELSLHVLLSVLVASCPCALSLAIPSVFAAASGRLAGDGVLVARPSVFARLPRVTHVLFDKTGTLTETRLTVVSAQALAALPLERCRAIAAALERDLTHPIAQALAAQADVAGREDACTALDVGLLDGGGVHGWVDGQEYRLAAAETWIAEDDDRRRRCEREAPHCTWIALADVAGRPLAVFGLRARLRDDAVTTVTALRAQGAQVWLLTGDSEAAAQALARHAGVDVLRARQTPEMKLAELQALQARGAVVMAVGDGINDAPLLAAADVAVAMPAGAALAQARADVILTGEALAGLLRLRAVAARAARRVRENLGWSLGYNLLMLPIAFSGSLTPWLAALGMSISSLIVVVNALRVQVPVAPDAAPHLETASVIAR